MRRKAGIRGIKQRQQQNHAIQQKGDELQAAKLEEMKKSMTKFQSELEKFARKHKKEINKDPAFRGQFNQMCMKIGVDPLASNKGFWSDMLGIGDFYYELSVQIIEVCLKTRNMNGGLIEINELCQLIKAKRKKQANAISIDDIKCAISKVKGLGNGFSVITIGRREMVKSVPMEFNRDHTTVLSHCQQNACATITQLERKTNWTRQRVEQTLNMMLNEGVAWIDKQGGDEVVYWFPSLWQKQ
eukprot:CAMPEP_0197027536 /NCGR_PEP_ID=MMETSP1384-20130603/7434_1 /TAXON_ID=29189 /ORGANISM="Ammonia sp." /LENGTH=242 /DNA_ID=CAMNT_0042456397 /DNA_START=40 /DNA_END=768 /DNA_ORIENTATION=-